MNTILVIDDDNDDVEAITQALYSVSPTTHCLCYLNPAVAISHLTSHSIPQIDCVLIDMYMHVLSGVDCLESIKRMPQFVGLDIIMISSSFRDGEGAALFRYGAKAVCVKPHSWQGFLDMSTAIVYGKTTPGSVMSFELI